MRERQVIPSQWKLNASGFLGLTPMFLGVIAVPSTGTGVERELETDWVQCGTLVLKSDLDLVRQWFLYDVIHNSDIDNSIQLF